MATKTPKFISLGSLAKRDKKLVGTGGDGGLLTDKINRRKNSKSTSVKSTDKVIG